MGDVELLQREMYSEAEAARLLGLAQSTLHYWLEGGKRRGVTYAPIIRLESTGARSVTWAEFVEAGWLKQYRREWRVPMPELRDFIAILRDRLGIPYPLATALPWMAEKRLVIEAQRTADLPAEFWLYAPVDNQLVLPLPAAQAFLNHVEFIDDQAALWRPHGVDVTSPVAIDPDVRFGRPQVKGISTSVIHDYDRDGYAVEEIADEFDLEVSDVEWALAYEHSVRAA